MNIDGIHAMSLRVLLVLCVLGGALSPVQAQSGPRARAEAVLPAGTFRDVEAIANEAGGRGIPTELLYSKALEGAAKKVPPPMLLSAVRGYAERLGAARQAFGAEAAAPMLVAGADAIQRGVTPDALRSMAEGGHHSPMAVLVLADLVETGVPSPQALQVLREAMSQRMNEQRMLQIPEHVRGLMREGHSPMAAAERVWSRMHRGPGGMGG